MEFDEHNIYVFRELFLKINFLGNDSKWGTPVPIPNTEVKPLNADNSVSEDRKLPRIFFVYKKIKKKILQGIFLQLYLYENSFKRIELSLKEGREPIT